MNPATLKSLVAAFHKKATSDLTVNGVDLFLVSANNAQTQAQRRHNFEFSRVTATLDIDGVLGANIADAVIVGQVSEVLTVTGTLSEAFLVGDYTPNGTYAGLPLWIQQGSIPGFIYFNPGNAKYILSEQLINDAEIDYWESASALTPVGILNPIGVQTGIATVAYTSRANWSGIREIVAVQRSTSDGYRIPLDFSRADIPIERDRTAAELTDFYDFRDRYPSDSDRLNQRWNTGLIQRGGKILVYPQPLRAGSVDNPLSVILEAFATLPALSSVGTSDDPDPNFLWSQGSDWLQWFIIHELNFYFKTYVQRNEGNIASPTDMRDQSWEDLLAWDTYMVDSNSTRSR